MMPRWFLVFAVVLVVVLVLAIPATAQTKDRSDIRGYITEKKDGTILVESRPCREQGRIVKYTRCGFEDWRGEKGFFAVTRKTTILDKSGSGMRPADFEDLKVGQTVKATYRWPVRESYPSDGGAGRISILAEAGRPVGG